MADPGHFTIRRAEAGDGEALAFLACQLGYPMESADAESQLSSLAEEEEHYKKELK
jgi:hypothetical protein